jgi:hypothetical protein
MSVKATQYPKFLIDFELGTDGGEAGTIGDAIAEAAEWLSDDGAPDSPTVAIYKLVQVGQRQPGPVNWEKFS